MIIIGSIGLILSIIGVIFWIKAKQLKTKLATIAIEEIDDNVKKARQAADAETDKWNTILENTKQLCSLEEKNQQLLIKHGKELADAEIEQYKIVQMSSIDLACAQKKQDLDKQLELKTQDINEQINNLLAQQQLIVTELNDYEMKRVAVNEAILREKEIQEQEKFYKIDIPENDRNDILILRDIEPKLRNKEAFNKLIYDVFIKRPSQEMIKRITKNQKICGIYKITYIKTGECYVGRSVDIGNRWKQHIMSSLNIGTIAHSTFHNFLADKGLHMFTFEILEEVEKEKCSEREKYWIHFYNADQQLNSNIGG